MLFSRSVFALVGCTASLVSAQFVKTPTNFTKKTGHAGVQVRYKEVPPGICELREDVKSFAGYADVAESEHIFWYVKTRSWEGIETSSIAHT
jgi:hypothetical protein